MTATARFEGQSDFAIFLRTGLRFRHQAGADVEVKFNPWHDPDDGRFTFAGQGEYFGGGEGGAAGGGRSGGGRGGGSGAGDASPAPGSYQARVRAEDAAIRRRNALNDPDHPSNYSLYKVQAGDTLTRIAAKRTGVTADDLAWLNGVRPDAPLRIGQAVKLPNQKYLDDGRDAFGFARGVAAYLDRHGGKMPLLAPDLRKALPAERLPVFLKNGYPFQQDGLFRTRLAEGALQRERSTPSKTNQRRAGGTDRRVGDEGGHYIARRFNGPSDSVNLFAQDSNFNRGAYRVLEDKLAAYQQQGKDVYVRIIPHYRGISQRPYAIDYWWRVDGKWTLTPFHNDRGGRRSD